MIIIRGYEYYKNGDGKWIPVRDRIIEKFSNFHDFGFDIYSTKNWKDYLKSYRTKDKKLLPRKSERKEIKIRYAVYVFGIHKNFPRKFDSHKGGIMYLFPDYDYDSRKVLPVYEFGGIDD